MSRHVNIPIFIPHLGCPNLCVFCNQRTICGKDAFSPDSIRLEIEAALSTIDEGDECEIAFFGGSFTGIERELMIRLLEIANEYVSSDKVKSIRCSTRPDYIDEEIISILKRYNVDTVELGLQSFSDEVLSLTKRGHSRTDAIDACKAIVSSGLTLVGQMMIGLPGSTIEDELETAEQIALLGAKYARIYPTVVFRDTELCDMAERGLYTPLSLEAAIDRSAQVYLYLLNNGVSIIRVGLCASENLSDESKYYDGPNHPALGELVLSRVFYKKITCALSKMVDISGRNIRIFVPRGFVSCTVGQHRENVVRLEKEFNIRRIKVSEDLGLSDFEIKIIVEREGR